MANTRNAEAFLANIRLKFTKSWFGAIGKYNAAPRRTSAEKNLALSELERSFHRIIEAGWSEAYELGFETRAGFASSALSTTLDASIVRQKSFATVFASDIGLGIPSMPRRMPIVQRSNLYANSVVGGFNVGAVEGGTSGQKIYWVLGAAEHCADCPVLEINSPYTLNTLPTYPRSGETECRMNCNCYLEFLDSGNRRAVLGTPPPIVKQVLSKPPAPVGLRHPTSDELDVIIDLETRLNYARRQMAITTGVEQRSWISLRRKINGELIDYLEKRQIWSVPAFSVSEVIRGRIVPPRDIKELTVSRGLDGRTINRVDAQTRARVVQKMQAEINDTLSNAVVLAGAVMDFSVQEIVDLLVKAGAPESIFKSLEDAQNIVINSVGFGLSDTLNQHLKAFKQLADGDYAIEIGPYGSDWIELSRVLGTWISGPPDEVERFIRDWVRNLDTSVPALAFWKA